MEELCLEIVSNVLVSLFSPFCCLLVLDQRCCVVDELLNNGVPACWPHNVTFYLSTNQIIITLSLVLSVCVAEELVKHIVDGLLSKAVPA